MDKKRRDALRVFVKENIKIEDNKSTPISEEIKLVKLDKSKKEQPKGK